MNKLIIIGLIILFVALCFMLSEYTTEEHEMSLKKQIAFDLSKMTLAIIAGICLAYCFVGMANKQNFLMIAGLSALIIDFGTSIIYTGIHLVKNMSR